MITDRDLAVEYARRHGLRRRQWGETAARFRARVALELQAAGDRGGALMGSLEDRAGLRRGPRPWQEPVDLPAKRALE